MVMERITKLEIAINEMGTHRSTEDSADSIPSCIPMKPNQKTKSMKNNITRHMDSESYHGTMARRWPLVPISSGGIATSTPNGEKSVHETAHPFKVTQIP
jgi:hypothetical protein